MMSFVLQYFTVLDKDGNQHVHIKEVLSHCYPQVDAAALEALQVWLYPSKERDELLHEEYQQLLRKQPRRVTDQVFPDFKELDRIRRVGDPKYPFGIMCKSALIVALFGAGAELEAYQHARDDLAPVHESDIPNFFSATIFAITSAIKKLAKQQLEDSKDPKPLYRSFRFHSVKPPDMGGQCFCEFGFFSTSADKKQALQYASGSQNSFLFEIQSSPLAAAADVQKYSQ
jgi:hypothetical protein